MLASLLKGLLRGPGTADVPRTKSASSAGTREGLSGEADFVQSILREFFIHAHRLAQDNYDHARFDPEIQDQSGIFDVATHAHYLQFFMEHAGEFNAACQCLADGESRELFRRLILYRLLGHTHVAIRDGFAWQDEEALYRRARQYDADGSSLDVSGMFGRIRHFEGLPVAGGLVSLDCWPANVVYTVFKRQYYFSRGNVTIEPRAGDVVFDIGACFGDTAIQFAQSVGDGGHVYSFDPLPAHRKVIDFNIAQNRLEGRITVVQCAIGDRTSASATPQGMDSRLAQPGFSLYMTSEEFPLTTLDDFVRERSIPRADFIKMDIEGYELAALMGAENVIRQFRPRLAISLYHRPEDYFEIPLWIASRFPWYELHLDHYTLHREETVLFASPAK